MIHHKIPYTIQKHRKIIILVNNYDRILYCRPNLAPPIYRSSKEH